MRVLGAAARITASIAISDTMRDLAHITALYHDVGRFQQYEYFKTFDDSRSINHSLLALDVLRERKVLLDLSPAHRRLVLGAIWLHNRLAVPAGLSPGLDLLARIVRDADKLDIFFLMLDYFNSGGTRNDVVTLHLEDHPTAYTESVFEDVKSGKQGKYREMAWVNDVKLIMCGWVYDLNFPASRKILTETGRFENLLSLLPDAPEMASLKEKLRRDLMAGSDCRCSGLPVGHRMG